jgi:hypothetical protein
VPLALKGLSDPERLARWSDSVIVKSGDHVMGLPLQPLRLFLDFLFGSHHVSVTNMLRGASVE